jgi:hypothetical protein
MRDGNVGRKSGKKNRSTGSPNRRLEILAEEEGFEPPEPVKVQRFSRPPP